MEIAGYLLSIPVDFKIALARIRFSHHVILLLKVGEVKGYGEGILYRVTLQKAAEIFHTLLRPKVEDLRDVDELVALRAQLIEDITAQSPAMAYAFDTAVWDVLGQTQGKPLVDLLGGMKRERVPITEQIFIEDWQKARTELEEIISHGTKSLKVKIGISPQVDLELVGKIKEFVGDSVGIRVDANHTYGLKEGLELCEGLRREGVLAVEEPLHLKDWSGLRTLRRETNLPLILDESIMTVDDLKEAVQEEALDVLNFKLTRMGGISQALKYKEICDEHGIKVSTGCSEDLGLGMAAVLHFGASIEELHSTEGMGNLRLGLDIIEEEMPVVDGEVQVPLGEGLGVHLNRDRLPNSVRVFDLKRQGKGRLWLYSHYARIFQRWNNVLHRARRRLSSDNLFPAVGDLS